MANYCKILRQIEDSHAFKYATVINTCLDCVLDGQHSVDPFILDIDGMSGRLYRQWINLIVNQVDQPRYLEIGAWHGSTLCSAVANNFLSATVVDNWTLFDGSRKVFETNLEKICGTNKIDIIENDFRCVDWQKLDPHNIYLYDGPHQYQDQYDGLALILPALDDEFILIVDDWNDSNVQNGTLSALSDLKLDYKYISIQTTEDGSHPHWCRQQSDWHNGYFLASVKKSQKSI
jgi:hypothetical protein